MKTERSSYQRAPSTPNESKLSHADRRQGSETKPTNEKQKS
jgi:hypothetical protein